MSVLPVNVLYSDEQMVVVNKPSGLLSVPGRGPDKAECVVVRLQSAFPTVRVVHRLDCHTSGLMVLALTVEAHRELSRQFHDRETEKGYRARVEGVLEKDSGEVNLPLMTDWPNRPRQMVSEEGKQAHTRWHCLQRENETSWVALTPITGRTHQLRVHMMAIGHPIVGDRLYATGKALDRSDRLLLHAERLAIKQPLTGERLEFKSECPFL
jgi:tRNA pseudouridine32 synthase/23S rRNA pseudouridine746 synthase